MSIAFHSGTHTGVQWHLAGPESFLETALIEIEEKVSNTWYNEQEAACPLDKEVFFEKLLGYPDLICSPRQVLAHTWDGRAR